MACGVGGCGLADLAAPGKVLTVTVGLAAVAAAVAVAEDAARNGHVRGGAKRAIRIVARPIIATARPSAFVRALARLPWPAGAARLIEQLPG